MSNDKYTYCVITRIPDPKKGEDGNLYNSVEEVFFDRQYPSGDRKPRLAKGCNYMLQNFALGEICILDEPLGREVAGKRRAPRKWFIEFEEFDKPHAAVRRAQEVLAESDRSA